MRKYLLLIGVLLSFTVHGFAAKTNVPMTNKEKGHLDNGKKILRSPLMLPIEVSYDDETRQIEITGGDDLVGQVSLRDADGNILAFSTEINTVLEVPSSYTGTIIVHIEGENWISVGEVIL